MTALTRLAFAPVLLVLLTWLEGIMHDLYCSVYPSSLPGETCARDNAGVNRIGREDFLYNCSSRSQHPWNILAEYKQLLNFFGIQVTWQQNYQPGDAQAKLYIHSSTVYAHDNYEQSKELFPISLIPAHLALALLLGALGAGVGAGSSSLASRSGWLLLLVLFIALARRRALLLLGGFIPLGGGLHLAAAALVVPGRSGLLYRLRRGLFRLLVLIRFFLLLLLVGLFATRGRCASNVLLELAGRLGVVILSPRLTGLVGLDLFLVDGQIISIQLLPDLPIVLVRYYRIGS